MNARRAGFVLVAAGALLALPEIFADAPVPLVFTVGLLLALAGGVLIADHGATQPPPYPREALVGSRPAAAAQRRSFPSSAEHAAGSSAPAAFASDHRTRKEEPPHA